MEGQHIKGLMEAYSHIYSEPEILNEEVEVEEVDMELEEDAEVLDEQGRNKTSPEQVAANRRGLANTLLYGNPEGRRTRVTTPRQRQRNRTSTQPTRPVANLPADYKKTELAAGAAAEKSRPGAGLPVSGGGNQGSNRPAPRPSAAPASKPAAAAPAKPVVKQTGDKAKDMATWAKANPTLANKPKTPNPLMKDMPGATLKKAQEAPKPQMSARAQALKAGGPAGGARERMLNQGVDIFDLVKGHLLDEGYAETEENALVMMANMSEEWRETIIMELTGGKGHPGYKAGSKDHGDLEDHPAAGKKGGVLSPRYGHHLGDMDDEDEDEDDLESTVKQQSRDSRERTRKPLRDKVKAARKKMSKEGIELEDILALNRKMERVYEAQRARENPEGHDKEEKRKYEPVRGERTPMPPRGDKRREEFEKWYAKQMGR